MSIKAGQQAQSSLTPFGNCKLLLEKERLLIFFFFFDPGPCSLTLSKDSTSSFLFIYTAVFHKIPASLCLKHANHAPATPAPIPGKMAYCSPAHAVSFAACTGSLVTLLASPSHLLQGLVKFKIKLMDAVSTRQSRMQNWIFH